MTRVTLFLVCLLLEESLQQQQQLRVTTAAIADMPSSSNSTTAALRARWRGQAAVADVALEGRVNMSPSSCKVSVVGAAWSSAYFAWRLSVDSSTVNASDVCVFESYGRVGGRIDSIHDLPGFDDLAVDLGGYRFIETDLLPAQLVWRALELPTSCYDYQCRGGCPDPSSETNCYVVKDAYGNNAGYSTPIETMLGQIMDRGGQVYFGKTLKSVRNYTTLIFEDGSEVLAETVLLGIPANAIEALDISPPFDQVASEVMYDRVSVGPMNKVYAFYQDAWWNTKLGYMEGTFSSHNLSAPLAGRYHDGPQKCVVAEDPDGNPVYSGTKIPGGNCSGAIEVYYAPASPFYRQFMRDDLTPITVAIDDDHELKRSVHQALLDYHAEDFERVGLQTPDPPISVVLSNWITTGAFTPGIGFFKGSKYAKKLARNPTGGKGRLFVANQDYGYKNGWANGGLLMAEKLLQEQFHLSRPTWLDQDYYDALVTAIP